MRVTGNMLDDDVLHALIARVAVLLAAYELLGVRRGGRLRALAGDPLDLVLACVACLVRDTPPTDPVDGQQPVAL